MQEPYLDTVFPILGHADSLTLCSYFGKVGMRHFHMLRNHDWKPTINLDKVRLLRMNRRKLVVDIWIALVIGP